MASVTWETLKAQIARKLKDPEHNKYDETLLLDGINDALWAFAADHTGVASDIDYSGDGSTYEYDLPGDIVDTEDAGVYAVHWKNNVWIPEIEYWPGRAWESSTRSTASRPRAYVLWPTGKISFTRVPESGQTVTLYYVAHYPTVTTDSSSITVPAWAREALKLYVCARTLEPVTNQTADLARWKSKRDSGTPEHNPMLMLCEYYMKQYWHRIGRHSPPQYAKMMPEPEGFKT